MASTLLRSDELKDGSTVRLVQIDIAVFNVELLRTTGKMIRWRYERLEWAENVFNLLATNGYNRDAMIQQGLVPTEEI